MNTSLRRVSIAVMVMIVALLANATYAGHQGRRPAGRPANPRVLLDEYSRQRGQISAGGQLLAVSRRPTTATSSCACTRTRSPTHRSTGFYSMQYGSTGLERAEDPILNGSDNRLFGRRLVDLFSGRDPRGGNVVDHHQPGSAAGRVTPAAGLQGLHRCGRGDRAEHRQDPDHGVGTRLRPEPALQPRRRRAVGRRGSG